MARISARQLAREIGMAMDVSKAIALALDTTAGPALDGALAGIAEAFGLPEVEIRKVAGLPPEAC